MGKRCVHAALRATGERAKCSLLLLSLPAPTPLQLLRAALGAHQAGTSITSWTLLQMVNLPVVLSSLSLPQTLPISYIHCEVVSIHPTRCQ